MSHSDASPPVASDTSKGGQQSESTAPVTVTRGLLPPKGDPPPSDEIYQLPSNDYNVTKSGRRIFRALAPLVIMFVYYGEIVELCLIDKLFTLKPVKAWAFCSRVENLGLLVKRGFEKGKSILRPHLCSKDAAERLLTASVAKELLYPLKRVMASPVLIIGRDGHPEILAHGYHPHLGGLVVTGSSIPSVIPQDEAVETLLSLLQGFDFVSAADFTRAVACMLSPALSFGELLEEPHLPMFLIEADESGAGKTFFRKMITALYGESVATVSQRSGGVGSFDESLDALLLQGRPFIPLDNLRGSLSSPHLEHFLTEESLFGARTPHRAEVYVEPWRYIVLGTSNGFETTDDLNSRMLRIRILKRASGCDYHRPNGRAMLAYVRSHSSDLLGCIFAAIVPWILAGRPGTGETRHRFRAWAQPVDWICQNVFKLSARLMDDEFTDDLSHPFIGL